MHTRCKPGSMSLVRTRKLCAVPAREKTFDYTVLTVFSYSAIRAGFKNNIVSDGRAGGGAASPAGGKTFDHSGCGSVTDSSCLVRECAKQFTRFHLSLSHTSATETHNGYQPPALLRNTNLNRLQYASFLFSCINLQTYILIHTASAPIPDIMHHRLASPG